MLEYVKWTLSAVVLALASSLAFAASFEKARPVWPEASDGRPNENVRFAAAFETDGTPLTLRVTGADQYKILMDGEPIGWGPARAPKGWARVSEIPLKVAAGGHVLAFEVVGYNVVGLLSGCPQLPFLQAELVGPKGSVLAATGKGGAFRAQWISSRHRKVSRYTEQRGFIECWTVPETKGGDLALAERPGLRLTARRAPEPDLGALTIFRPIASQRVRHDPKVSCRLWEYVTKTSADPKAGYPLEEQVWDAVRKSQQFVAVDRLASVKDDRVQSLSDGLRLRYDCGTNLTGFVRMKVKVTKPGKLWLNWSELLVWFRVNSFKSRLADIAVWEFTEPGEYVVETIEPYTLRYLEATSEDGQFEIESVALRRLESPEVATAKLPKMPDVELDLILSAARNTLGQNTLDTFMDCPGRERAAWLCDSYFTAKGAFAVTGNTKVEKDFLENWLLAADYGELPEGMLPMAYPSSATRETYIPNWAMWYVLELDDYLKRSGDRAFVDAMKPRLAKLLAFFRRYRNSDGLLERLPGWVFIEWSAANDYVQDVNYPANMTWAGVLEAYGRMYGDAEATAEAAKVRETVFAQSFDGRMFRDHARRWDDGTLTVMPDCSETCQNYALFFRFGNRQTPGNWYETVLRQLGGNRILNPDVMPEISRSAPFIGDTLRILALSELNEREILIRDLKAFYLDQARRTGTLWETRRDVNSNCHGFAGVIAGVMLRLAESRVGASLALDGVFTDHMVLQRNRPIRFSGRAAAGATVEVELDGVRSSSKADENGRWTVELPARKEGGPYAVTVVRREGDEAKETLRLEDVLVGEVWLGSGQSNMEFWVLGENLENPQFYSLTNGEEVAATKDPLLRVLFVPHAVAPQGPRSAAKLAWKRAETREANGRMSAVAFLFGKELRRRLGPNVPVGIASAAWGGTEIETWIPEAQFKAQENGFDLSRLAAARLAGDAETRKAALKKAIYAKRSVDLRAWSDLLRATGEKPSAPLADFDGPGVTVKRIAVDIPAGWDGHAAELHLEGVGDFDRTRFGGVEVGATGVDTPSYWSAARNYRIASVRAGRQELEIEIEHHCGRARLGEKLTLKDLVTGETLDLGKLPRTSEVKLIGNPMRIGYRPPDPYNGVHGDPAEDPQMPTSLFNGMVAPLTAMNIGGVIWYQGCGNAHDPRRYRALQSDLVDGWRMAFRNSEMPFLITQVSTYSKQTPARRQADDFWKAETVPFKVRGFAPIRQAQDAMSASLHVGVACTIDIGDHSDIHPPNKQEVARRLGHEAMRVAFGDETARPAPRAKMATQTEEGVVVSFDETGRGLVLDGEKRTFHPHHFALAGRDGVFSWAEGRLRDDGTVLVTSGTVREPWYVQYCMSGCPVEVGFRRADDALPVMPFELEVRKPGVIRPGEMWRDTTGLPIHAHGGSILVAEGKFWWYGENKEGVDGRSKTWHRGVRAYTSENLVDWTDEGVIIEYDHEACMDRPHILYNAKTKKFVAWLKVMHGDRQTRTILTADRMKGAWKVEKDNFLPAGLSSGDFDLVAAEDGRAYAYFERPHDALVSAELTDDYLDLKPETVRFDFPNQKPPYTREAPAHFLKDGKHYLFTSGTSWYYPNPTEVAEADGWLGPWRKLGDAHPDDRSRTSFHSQISSVFKVPGKDLYIALADRWLPNQMDITYPAVENAFRRWFKHGGSDDALYDFLQTQRDGRKGDTCDARYVWLPVVFKDGVPCVEWRDEWCPDDDCRPNVRKPSSGPTCPLPGSWSFDAAHSDEFDGESLDYGRWWNFIPSFYGRPHGMYTSDCVSVMDGCLRLQARVMRPEERTRENLARGFDRFVTSAVKQKEKCLYGYFEARLKAADAGITTAFWLYDPLSDQPERKYRAGSASEEIDIVEIWGKCPKPAFSNFCYATVHRFETPYVEGLVNAVQTTLPDKQRHAFLPLDFTDEFHTYGFLWTKDKMVWYVDGKEFHRRKNDYYHTPLHVVFDCEVQGHWHGLPEEKDMPATVEVDYFRRWTQVER